MRCGPRRLYRASSSVSSAAVRAPIPTIKKSSAMPEQFFTIVVDDLARRPGFTSICAGFEEGEWRVDALAKCLFDSLPDFCLRYSEYSGINFENAFARLVSAAKKIYQTDKYKNRGEFGELLLHVALKQLAGTVPAISKLYFKDSSNHTVKGFDAVHVVPGERGLQLWLGEVKFYQDIYGAIKDVCEELELHFGRTYLRNEFLFVGSKIDDVWPHAKALRALLDENKSLDEIFDVVVCPVLLTYDSPTTAAHTKNTQAYLDALRLEVERHYASFQAKNKLTKVEVRLILFPLQEKRRLVDALHRKLEAMQCL
jgi:hypothetical protein